MNCFLAEASVYVGENYFQLGPVRIYFYALCIVSGFAACALLAVPLFKKRGFKPDILLDIFIAIVPCSILCARTWYVLFDLDEYFVNGKMLMTTLGNIEVPAFLAIWNGGMAIHGGVCGGALGLFIVSKIKKIPFARLGDFGAAMLPLGQAVGRLGNFFNQEVYGAVVPADKAWFPYATFISADGQWHVALCFHEMFFNLLAFAAIYFFLFNYKGKRNGYAIGLYFIYYGVIRAVMEPMREQTYNMGKGFLGMPTMFWLSLVIVAAGIAVLTVLIIKDVKDGNLWWKDFFKNIKEERQKRLAVKGADGTNGAGDSVGKQSDDKAANGADGNAANEKE